MQYTNFITDGPSWVNGLSWADIVIILLYFLFIVYLGVKYSKSKDEKSYFLAGRGITWPVIGFSLFAASISSSTLIGQAGDAYSTGIAVFNYNSVSVIVMVFFAWFILPFYIKSKIFTIPEFLEKRFNVASRYYFSAITIIVNIFLDAAGSLYAAAMVMKIVFPEVSILTLSIIFAIVVAAYTIPGGLSAAIRVDLMQGIFLLVGSVILTFYATYNGGAEYVKELLTEGDVLMKLVRPNDDSSVVEFLSLSGYLKAFSVFKEAWIWDFDDCDVSYYILSDGRAVIELEALVYKTSEEGVGIIDTWAEKLECSQFQQESRSLFEIFTQELEAMCENDGCTSTRQQKCN